MDRVTFLPRAIANRAITRVLRVQDRARAVNAFLAPAKQPRKKAQCLFWLLAQRRDSRFIVLELARQAACHLCVALRFIPIATCLRFCSPSFTILRPRCGIRPAFIVRQL